MNSSSTEVGVFVTIAGSLLELSCSDSRVRTYLDEYSFPFPADFVYVEGFHRRLNNVFVTFSNLLNDGVGSIHLPFPVQPPGTLWDEEVREEDGQA